MLTDQHCIIQLEADPLSAASADLEVGRRSWCLMCQDLAVHHRDAVAHDGGGSPTLCILGDGGTTARCGVGHADEQLDHLSLMRSVSTTQCRREHRGRPDAIRLAAAAQDQQIAVLYGCSRHLCAAAHCRVQRLQARNLLKGDVAVTLRMQQKPR